MTILQSGIAQAAAGGGGYQIARSLRFNSADSAYLNRTPASASNRQIWAWSGWVKRSKLGVAQRVLAGGSTGLLFQADDTLLFDFDGGSNYGYTSSVFRDIGAWYHIVFTLDTTLATSTDRAKLWINNVRQTLTYSGSIPLNGSGGINNNVAQYICSNGGSSQFCDLMLADVRLIDGQALDPTSFGEFDANTGVWNPKTYAGTYGTNGFWLKLDDNSNNTATTLGKDSSGNSNNWTPNNFSVTAGVGNDSLVDSPTNYGTDTGAGGEVRGNYATLNALDTSTALSNGNLDFVTGNGNYGVRSNFEFPASGKWYVECTLSTSTSGSVGEAFGFANSSASLTSGPNASNKWIIYADSTGSIYANGSTLTSGLGTFASGTVLQVAYDGATGNGWVGKNNTWYNSSGGTTGDPSTGANPTFTSLSNVFAYLHGINATQNFNAGQRPFAYTAPSGFKALTTTNLPTPAIGATSSTLANKNFDAVTYTGTGSSLSITSLAFQPDLAWIKGRSGATDHAIYDAVRGVQLDLVSNSTAAETTQAQGVTAFGSTGFTVGTLAKLNTSAATYVGWAFKGGNGTVSNTSGTITSTVSANPTAGISVVKYSGNGTAGATVGHGLGVAPAMVIVKSRTISPSAWRSYNKNLANAATTLDLNSDAAADGTNASSFNSTAPTSSVFSLGTSDSTNNSSATYVAYCFAEVIGFSKIGSYVGNGSADGTFVYTGFRPRYIMIKGTNTNHWSVKDTARSPSNVALANLFPNLSNAETSEYDYDILSNGFKIRTTSGTVNTSGQAYIFMAFAESPFNYARAR